MILKIIFIIALFVLSSCGSSVKYQTDFTSVTVNKKDNPTLKGYYEDKLIQIKASHESEMLLEIKNKSENKIKIIWDDCLFVDPLGTSHKVISSNTRYLARNESQPPTTILPETTFQDIISNVDNIFFEGSPPSWVNLGILRNGFGPMYDAKSIAGSYVGKPMKLLIVIENSDGKKQDYYLNFMVKGYSK